MTTNPHHDAEFHEDALQASDDAHEYVCARIHQTMTQDVQHVESLQDLCIADENVEEIVCDALQDEAVLGELYIVLMRSRCEHVADLRQAICEEFTKRKASKINPSQL